MKEFLVILQMFCLVGGGMAPLFGYPQAGAILFIIGMAIMTWAILDWKNLSQPMSGSTHYHTHYHDAAKYDQVVDASEYSWTDSDGTIKQIRSVRKWS